MSKPSRDEQLKAISEAADKIERIADGNITRKNAEREAAERLGFKLIDYRR